MGGDQCLAFEIGTDDVDRRLRGPPRSRTTRHRRGTGPRPLDRTLFAERRQLRQCRGVQVGAAESGNSAATSVWSVEGPGSVGLVTCWKLALEDHDAGLPPASHISCSSRSRCPLALHIRSRVGSWTAASIAPGSAKASTEFASYANVRRPHTVNANTWLVTNHLDGNFPGSVVQYLRYQFTFWRETSSPISSSHPEPMRKYVHSTHVRSVA